MKKSRFLLSLAPLCLAALAARADVVVVQKMESAMLNGDITMKLKGDQARMDMSSPMGAMSVLMNVKSGDMTTLMHAQKMAMKMNMADAKKQSEMGQKAMGIDPSKIERPKPTGQKEKVGQWDAEIYDMAAGGVTGKLWVAKDFPNAQKIKDEMNKISAASSPTGFDPSKMDVPGMVVKTEMNTPMGRMTTTLVKAAEEPVADADFAMPQGYQEMKMPTQSAAPAAPAP